jgi:hypothetical protein
MRKFYETIGDRDEALIGADAITGIGEVDGLYYLDIEEPTNSLWTVVSIDSPTEDVQSCFIIGPFSIKRLAKDAAICLATELYDIYWEWCGEADRYIQPYDESEPIIAIIEQNLNPDTSNIFDFMFRYQLKEYLI